jgi:hypothetical protein
LLSSLITCPRKNGACAQRNLLVPIVIFSTHREPPLATVARRATKADIVKLSLGAVVAAAMHLIEGEILLEWVEGAFP